MELIIAVVVQAEYSDDEYLLIFAVFIGIIIFVKIAQTRRASEGTYHPSQQEMVGPRIDVGDSIKPPPSERLI